MLHSNSVALGLVIGEQRVVLLPEFRSDLGPYEVDCVLLVKDLAMRVRCFVVVVSARLDWMAADALSSIRQGGMAA